MEVHHGLEGTSHYRPVAEEGLEAAEAERDRLQHDYDEMAEALQRESDDNFGQFQAAEARARQAEEALEELRGAANKYLARQNFGGTLEMRQLLAEASVMAEASAAALEQPTSHSKPGSTILASRGRSTLEEIAHRFARCRTDQEAGSAVEWARKELAGLKGQNRPKPRNERTLLIREWEGIGDGEVSRVTGMSRTNIRRWREEAGRDPRDGKRYKFARRAA